MSRPPLWGMAPIVFNDRKIFLGNAFNISCPNPGRREKIKLNFYFHTSFWCLKRFYEGLKGLHKTF